MTTSLEIELFKSCEMFFEHNNAVFILHRMVSMFLTLPWKEMFVAGSLTFLSDHYLHLLFLNAEQQPIKVKLYKNVLF